MQALLMVPVTFSILLLGVHCVQLAHSGHVAVAAATRGAQIASTAEGQNLQVLDAVDAAQAMVEGLGSRLKAMPDVVLNDRSVRVTVDVSFVGALPFLPDHAARSVTFPREQFIQESDR